MSHKGREFSGGIGDNFPKFPLGIYHPPKLLWETGVPQSMRRIVAAAVFSVVSCVPNDGFSQELSAVKVSCSLSIQKPDIVILDIGALQQRIHEIFADENGEASIMSRDISAKLLGALSDTTVISTINMWVEEIQKYTGSVPSNDEVIMLINLLMHIKNGDYKTSEYLIEGIIINAKKPSCMQQVFNNLDLLSLKI